MKTLLTILVSCLVLVCTPAAADRYRIDDFNLRYARPEFSMAIGMSRAPVMGNVVVRPGRLEADYGRHTGEVYARVYEYDPFCQCLVMVLRPFGR